MRTNLILVSTRLAIITVAVICTGCAKNADTDGRYWRQPVAKKRVRPTAFTVNKTGGTATYGVGDGFTVSDQGHETGGASVGRVGHTARMEQGSGHTAEVGEVYDGRRYGVTNEHRVYVDTVGGTMTSKSYSEGTASYGVQRTGD